MSSGTADAAPASRTPSRPFGDRLAEAIDARGRLAVGIDPHAALLAAWGLRDDVAGLREFALRSVEALAPHAGVIKPQAAFFERHGSAGLAVLEEVVSAVRAAGGLSIVDAKRGDIGSTMQGYADAYLREGSPLAGDAVTLSTYLGTSSLAPAFATAAANGRGVFVLCLTSNPEGAQVQHAREADGTSVAARVARTAAQHNAAEVAAGAAMGSVGLVVGATVGGAASELGVDLEAVAGPLLVPGFGAQGGTAADVRAVVGGAFPFCLPSTSRGVLGAGPDGGALAAAAQRARREIEEGGS
ncbi:orotidine-5'-phosphate decarboxylase [Litorihabitans aurantiacus]|uniref:Orotidine 5'-phosphate decarboxylase n=1 Tax=Litorihabitans aurantiacus TaxID=1930061 RepID=A0AA37UI48_9MICO|nr:orotidine-5'-phosphate decarboxylase [Litorihabitans aurantiacus]GMA31308.1 orotidine 5'-phosphate decarboxylase [Litorihabitans aurantiacus]